MNERRSVYVLTFDIDWAPDWMIAQCMEICDAARIPAIYFVTHRSDILDDMKKCSGIELGIHPNFLPRSSHGASMELVLDHCLDIVPDARVMRTHSLVQSSRLLHFIEKETLIESDMSLFIPFAHDLRPSRIFFETGSRGLRRFPYYWEDDLAACWPGWQWDSRFNWPTGLKIFDFHPIHVALNMKSMESYAALKQSSDKPLSAIKEADLAPFMNHEAGTRTFLQQLLNEVPSNEWLTYSQLLDLNGGGLPCE